MLVIGQTTAAASTEVNHQLKKTCFISEKDYDKSYYSVFFEILLICCFSLLFHFFPTVDQSEAYLGREGAACVGLPAGAPEKRIFLHG